MPDPDLSCDCISYDVKIQQKDILLNFQALCCFHETIVKLICGSNYQNNCK